MSASIPGIIVTLTRVGAALVFLMTAGTPVALAQSAFWNTAATAGGSWGTPSNWQGGIVPSGAGNAAGFVLDFNSGASVTLDGNRVIGTVISSSANPWSLDPGLGGVLFADNVIVTGGGPLTVTAPLVGGDFTKDGSGTLILSNPASAYSGAININAGVLKLVGSGNYSHGSNTVYVAAGATLDVTGLTGGLRYGGDPSLKHTVDPNQTLTGEGAVWGGLTVRSGGTVYPGTAGVGTLTVNFGDGRFESGSNWKVRLGTANPGVGASNTSNRLDFGGIIDTRLTLQNGVNMPIDGSGLTFDVGRTYDYIIASNINAFTIGAVNFQPTNFNPSAFASPSSFSLITSGANLVLRYAPVSEPAFVMALFLGGAAGYGVLRRRRTRCEPSGTAPSSHPVAG
jgi:autotransporter-associated beta strand protein